MIKILTFQHKDILKELKEKGVYIPSIIGEYNKRTPKSYKEVFNSIKKKNPSSNGIPIFGWANIIEGKSIDDVDEETLSVCFDKTGFTDEYIAILMEKEDDEVSLQSFYTFVALRCEEEGIDVYYTFDKYPTHFIYEITEPEVQCTFTDIKVKDIKCIYDYDLELDKNNTLHYLPKNIRKLNVKFNDEYKINKSERFKQNTTV